MIFEEINKLHILYLYFSNSRYLICIIFNYCIFYQVEDIIRSDIQLILENIQTYKVKTIELADEEYKKNDLKPILEEVGDVLGDLPLVQAELLLISEDPIEMPSHITVENKKLQGESNTVIFIGANLLTRPDVSIIFTIIITYEIRNTLIITEF